MSGNRIEVRPLDRLKWHGKKGKESFAQPHTIQALVDPSTMEYAVDLSEEERKELESKTSYDLSLTFDPENPHPFWDGRSSRIKLENKTMFFFKNVALDKIKVAIMKASKLVANSLKEWEEGEFPDATHYIHDESEQVQIKASKVEMRNEAIIETSKLPKDRKISIVKTLAGGQLKDNSDSFLAVEINKLIEHNTELYLQTLRRDPKEVSYLALVYEALDKNIFRKEGHLIKYLDSSLGGDAEEVAEYLRDDKNQEFTLMIKTKVSK